MKRKILIIDDETDFTDVIRIRLESSGYTVVVANSGADGLVLAEKEHPSLILLDIMMPEMDGMEVLRRLKASVGARHIPVIMLTARGETQTIFKAEQLGMTDYLIKPCESAELLKTIRRYAP